MAEEQIGTIIQQYFPSELQQMLLRYEPLFSEVQEIRCRIERPLVLRLRQNREQIVIERLTAHQLHHIVDRITQGSVYAWEEEFRQGYLTLHGGHRVGLAGKGVLEHGRIRTLKQISGLNFRIARSISGAADRLIPHVIESGRLRNTLLISPPGCGKTTMLRDLICQLSDGIPEQKFAGVNIGVVDERSELAGCVNGIPQLAIGMRTDVLDGCPKSLGMEMLLRSMTPQVLAVDEIGSFDVNALENALRCGCKILATLHGEDMNDFLEKPGDRIFKQQGSQADPGGYSGTDQAHDHVGIRSTVSAGI
jgi:stage III sporulation protein AA